MSRIPPDLRYTREHEWASLGDDGTVKVGITDFAQERLGDVVYLDLPELGSNVTAGESMGEVESTKSVSDIYAPLTGSVAGLNAECRDNPALVNQDPYDEGWLVAIHPGDAEAYESLLTAEEYEALVRELEGDAGPE
jgi:glycine cleavage system H protein